MDRSRMHANFFDKLQTTKTVEHWTDYIVHFNHQIQMDNRVQITDHCILSLYAWSQEQLDP